MDYWIPIMVIEGVDGWVVCSMFGQTMPEGQA